MNMEAIGLLTKSAIYALSSTPQTNFAGMDHETYGAGLFTLLAM